MTPEQRAALVVAQTAMMQAEMQIMIAENIDREIRCYAPANGPDEWAAFHAKWAPVLGLNELIAFFQQ